MAVVTILASAGLATATTTAAWTDSVSVTGIEIDTGTTNIQASANNSTWSNTSVNSTFALTGLIPGHEKDGGSAFYIRQTDGDNVNGVSLKGQINTIELDTLAPSEKSKLSIQVYDLDNPANNSGWVTLDVWEAGNVSFNSSVTQPNVKNFGLKVLLDPSAGNEWQNQDLSFTMEVTGTQL